MCGKLTDRVRNKTDETICDQNIDTHYDRQCQGVNSQNSTQDTFQYQQYTAPNLKILTAKPVTLSAADSLQILL